MKSRLLTPLLLLTMMMMMAAPQALALDIQVSPSGKIDFFSGWVLGDDDGEIKQENREDDKKREEKSENHREERIKSVNQGEHKELRVLTDRDKVKIELREKPALTPMTKRATNFKKTEEMESDNIRMQFPTHSSERQLEAAKKKLELKSEKVKDAREDLREETKTKLEEKREEAQAYREHLRENRQDREEELVELKSKLKDKKQVLEFKSRNVKAALKQGAEFTLDPETNEVTIVTPSGEEHTLNHLPDQALERMTAAGLFNSTDQTSEEEVTVDTNTAGELVYKKRDTIKRKLFGLFPRQINSEIILNDATGNVTEQAIAPSSIFEQFFNAVSF